MMILKLAWRNLLRNKRRSLITISAICFAVFFSVVMRGEQLGMYAHNIKLVVQSFTGYLQIQKTGFDENPSLEESIKLSDRDIENIKKLPKIESIAPRIIAVGLVGKKDNSIGASIIGVDPILEKTVSTIDERVNTGRFVNNKNVNEIVVGYKMLDNLNVKIGDTVVILANGRDGAMGNAKYIIAGTMKLGSEEFDKMSIIMNIKAADELLAMNGYRCSYSVNLADINDIATAQAGLDKYFSTKKDISILDWKKLMPGFVQSIEMDNASGVIYMFILIFIVAFGIFNTLNMSITERYKEFGVMLAIGVKRKLLTLALFYETLYMSFIGVLLGSIFGYMVNYYFYYYPYRLQGGMDSMMEEYGFDSLMVSSIDPWIIIDIAIIIFVTTLVVFILPAIKISRLEALKGIRYT